MAEYHNIFNDENCIENREKRLEYNSPNVSILEVASWFDGKEEQKDLKELQEAWQEEIDEIRQEIPEIEKLYAKRRGMTTTERKNRMEAMKMLYVDFFVDQIQEKLDRVNRVLGFAQSAEKSDQARNNQARILRAKSSPIDSFVKFDRSGFAKCIFPDHNEKTGSMKYYKKENRVHCFGCNKSGDSIDAYMAVRGCSFGDAVDALARS
jgi:hypothetical protein